MSRTLKSITEENAMNRKQRTAKLIEDMMTGCAISWREILANGVDAERVMRALRRRTRPGNLKVTEQLLWQGHRVTKLTWSDKIDDQDHEWDEDRYYDFTVPAIAGQPLDGCERCARSFSSADFREYVATLRGGGLALLMGLSVR